MNHLKTYLIKILALLSVITYGEAITYNSFSPSTTKNNKLSPKSKLKALAKLEEIVIDRFKLPRGTFGKLFIDYYTYKRFFKKSHMKKELELWQERGLTPHSVIPIHLILYNEKIPISLGKNGFHPKYKNIASGLIDAYLDSSANVNNYTLSAIMALQQLDLQGKTVIDLGSGDGILSIVAAKLGAKEVIAIDDIEDAQYLGRLNAERNQVQDQISFLHESFSLHKLDENQKQRLQQADVILMNQPSLTRDNFLDELFNQHPDITMKCIIFAGGDDDINKTYGIMSDLSNHPISRKQGFQNMGLEATKKIVVDDHSIMPATAYIFQNRTQLQKSLSPMNENPQPISIQKSA